jgi:hypothetical protein
MWNQRMWNYKVGRQFIAQLHRAGPYAAAVILIAREPIERDEALLEETRRPEEGPGTEIARSDRGAGHPPIRRGDRQPPRGRSQQDSAEPVGRYE